MKREPLVMVSGIISLAAMAQIGVAQTPLGTSFTYQGQLRQDGQALNGPVNLVFRLFDAAAGGNLRGTQTLNGVVVTNGLFTVQLNGANEFGSLPFNGDAVWLEVAVNGTTLLPRQALSGAPYALGIRLPLNETVASSADSINITQTGTGDAAQFNITNASNVGEAVEARTNGSGDAVQAVATGIGRAGYFQISNAASAANALYVTSNGTGQGIFSIKTAGAADAIYGESAAGNFGRLGTNVYGAYAQHASSGNFGYLGSASYGLFAQHDASGNFGLVGSSTYGVRGFGAGANTGVYGSSVDGRGIWGSSTNYDAIGGYASTANRSGVYGQNDTAGGYGVYGRNTSGTTDSVGYLGGVYGAYGVAPSGGGFFDTPNGFTGAGCFIGASDVGDALFASKTAGDGVCGRFQSEGSGGGGGVLIIHNGRGNALEVNNNNTSATSSRLADLTGTGQGSFGVFISVPAGHTGLAVVSGTKNAVVRTTKGARYLYAEEASEVWFSDYGSGELVNGRAQVAIDPLMAETVNLKERYHVFVQPNSAECKGLAVVNRTPAGFEVVEVGGGTSSGEFSYRLVAKRLGYEKPRLDPCPQAETDPNIYPERLAERDAQRRALKAEPKRAVVERPRESRPPVEDDEVPAGAPVPFNDPTQ